MRVKSHQLPMTMRRATDPRMESLPADGEGQGWLVVVAVAYRRRKPTVSCPISIQKPESQRRLYFTPGECFHSLVHFQNGTQTFQTDCLQMFDTSGLARHILLLFHRNSIQEQ